jgi:Mg2+-importing ATPase
VLNAITDLATFAVLAFALHGPGTRSAAFRSGWFTENLITQALVMVLLRAGRRGADGRRPGPVGWAAIALSVIGLALPASPMGPLIGFAAPPVVYYLLLTVVVALYAAALRAASARYGRRRGQSVAAALRRS